MCDLFFYSFFFFERERSRENERMKAREKVDRKRKDEQGGVLEGIQINEESNFEKWFERKKWAMTMMERKDGMNAVGNSHR